MSENHFQPLPVAIYGVVLFMCGVAYYIFERILVRNHGADSPLSRALGAKTKEILSVLIYAVAIPLAFWQPVVACALYVLVAVMWLCPDPRIERLVTK